MGGGGVGGIVGILYGFVQFWRPRLVRVGTYEEGNRATRMPQERVRGS